MKELKRCSEKEIYVSKSLFAQSGPITKGKAWERPEQYIQLKVRPLRGLLLVARFARKVFDRQITHKRTATFIYIDVL